jgi:hypothetical protein
VHGRQVVGQAALLDLSQTALLDYLQRHGHGAALTGDNGYCPSQIK